MIPVFLQTPEFSEPPDPVYHLVAANGTFLVNKTALFTSVTAAHRVPGLEPRVPSLDLYMPRVPRLIMERLYGFFRAIYEQVDGEAVAFIYHAPATGAFRIAIPPQTLYRTYAFGRWRTEKRVSYGFIPRADGFVKLGDAHSHCDQVAAFSCTDDRDDTQDGLRIVLGSLHRRPPDVGVSFVANGNRFTLSSETILEDFRVPLTPPRAWLDRVVVRMNGRYLGYRYGASPDPAIPRAR